MTISECEFYCLSHNNPIKKKRMEERFQELNIDCLFYDGLNKDDIRINGYNINKFLKRKWSITYSHLDIIKQFYINSDKKYAVICEDDICIHRNIKYILNKITSDFNILNLDILLLGYMLPYKIDNEHISMNYKLKANINVKSSFKYHEYPEYLSGCQMYMISRNYAHYLLTTYYHVYASVKLNKPFLSEKIIIKDGNRALIYPMLAVEDEHQDDLYHQLCHNVHFNENYI
jgi:GR25 family glycosyltransferase involved in LPS biosynthesis